MTTERRFERDLPDLLGQLSMGPMPDYRDDIVRRTAGTRQRPAWAFPERWISMATFTARTAVVRQMPWRAMGLIALLILTLLAAAFIVGSQQPRPLPAPFGPAANGSVIYAADGDIYSVDPVTKTAKAIVSGPELDFDPVWSRDGSRFAFMRQTADGIYVARSDGGDVRRVVPVASGYLLPDGEILEYSFSPDGSELLVAIRCGQTFIGKTDGSGVRELAGVSTHGDARFRPGGKQIAFTPCDETGIALVNTDGQACATSPVPWARTCTEPRRGHLTVPRLPITAGTAPPRSGRFEPGSSAPTGRRIERCERVPGATSTVFPRGRTTASASRFRRASVRRCTRRSCRSTAALQGFARKRRS
jgi:hypothetical protein